MDNSVEGCSRSRHLGSRVSFRWPSVPPYVPPKNSVARRHTAAITDKRCLWDNESRRFELRIQWQTPVTGKVALRLFWCVLQSVKERKWCPGDCGTSRSRKFPNIYSREQQKTSTSSYKTWHTFMEWRHAVKKFYISQMILLIKGNIWHYFLGFGVINASKNCTEIYPFYDNDKGWKIGALSSTV